MASYAFATLQARQTLQELWEQGKTVKGMAAALDVPLSTVFGSRFQRTMHNIGEGAWIGGKCWVFPYYDQNGELAFQRFPADEVLPFWADADHTILDAAVHVYEVAGNLEATTMNSATAQACGDRKRRFSLVFMHSAPATNLENLNLLTALKYTDKEGVTRDLTLYTWNGKLVIVDDGMPVEAVAATYKLTSDTALVTGKTYYTKSGTKYNAVASPSVDNIATYYEVDVPAGEEYTSYVLGEGSINFEDLGVKVPYEMSRDPAKNGGQDTLYTRQRKVFAPKGISYEKTSQTTLSPTDEELSDGANWALVHSGEATESQRSYINHKVIPIARIKSRG